MPHERPLHPPRPAPRPLTHRLTSKGAARAGRAGLALLALAGAVTAWSHGNVTPQAVDTTGLAELGPDWRAENPYRANDLAVTIGSSAYNQNCARCHGLEVISGGIAPDLRKLDNDCAGLADAARRAACVKETDEYFISTVRKGRTRNGAVYMPPFEGMVSQEGLWSIKAYLETRRDKPFQVGQ